MGTPPSTTLEDHAVRTDDAPLMLSVSGARGIVGRSMTPTVAAEFAAAFASHLREHARAERPLVCVGRDSRTSGEMLTRAAVAGLAAVGCRVVDLDVVATPTVGVTVAARDADGGLVVTASHNPAPWNGLKCIVSGGIAAGAERAGAIIERFRQRAIDYVGADAIAPLEREPGATDAHVARILEHVDSEAARAAWLKVAIDPGNGAGGAGARALLEALRCEVVAINEEPSGVFARNPEPLESSLAELMARTRETDAMIGFAQDPDADRLALVDENGRYVGEECTLVLAARYLLAEHGPGVLAANLSTSRMIDDVAAEFGATVIRTPVGEANVAAALRREPQGALLGGEGNGGVIVPAIGWIRDSLAAMALVLALLAREGRPLSAIVDDLPRYRMIKRRLDLSSIGGRAALGTALGKVTTAFGDAEINADDGVRIDFEEGWVHLRASNTEPIVRLIAEARDAVIAAKLADRVAAAAGLGGE